MLILYCLFTVFFLCIGSFLNVVISRLPNMLEGKTTINLYLPRSFCPHCKTPIKIRHNIPLLSYYLLWKRCNACKHPISIRYPIVEGLTCLLCLYTFWFFGLTWTCVFALLFVWLSIALFFIDIEKQLLPDSLTLGLLWLGLLANTHALFTNLSDAVIGAVIAYLFLWSVMKIFYLITKKIGMGYGDFKLFAALGAWFGWKTLPFILLFSSIIGSIWGILYLWYYQYSKNTPIPFGPFLCLAGLTVLFIGA